ncbi:hypothetical protein RPE78_01765 [Thioclava litoralis]|uniref:Uncharacterized protein n=1 Tax=Thioclava litoralis TaxID=3076557 RepID=A0ABZ1E052_9RHOB|nr:hypothetical protein RPE78_01765 [Thioclava sp. FTW29]
MRALVLAFPLALLATVSQAEDATPPLDAAGFDARTTGKTITYSANGQAYGIEQYLPGHKVLWAFTESACKVGTWQQQGEEICFDYQDENGQQCWKFYDTDKGLKAQFMGDGGMSEPLISLSESETPLNCPGPDIGV